MDLKEEILNAAKNEFWKNGYDGTRIQTIADSLDVSTNVIYNMFQNKAVLFDALVEEGIQLFVTCVEQGVSEGIKNMSFDSKIEERICSSILNQYTEDMVHIHTRFKDAIVLGFLHGDGSVYEEWKQSLILRITEILKVYYNKHVGKPSIVDSSILNILCEYSVNAWINGFALSFSEEEFVTYARKTFYAFLLDFAFLCTTECPERK